MSLKSVMGQFGAPEPPTLEERAMELAEQAGACSVPFPHEAPDDVATSFVLASSPFTQAFSENNQVSVACKDASEELDRFTQVNPAPDVGCEPMDFGDHMVLPVQHDENSKPSQPRMPGNTEISRQISATSEKSKHYEAPSFLSNTNVSSNANVSIHESGLAATRPMLPDEVMTVEAAASLVTFRDIAELRSFRNPPAVVCQVLEAVALLLGEADPRWAKMRKLLDNTFGPRILAFDPTRISAAQADRLRVLLQVPTFSDGSLGDRCPPLVPLAVWCNAVGRHLEAQSCAPGSPGADAGPPQAEVAEFQEVQSRREPGRVGNVMMEPNLLVLPDQELERVQEFRVFRDGVGSVTFHGETDCRGLLPLLTDIVVLNPGEVVVYPDQQMKPPVGLGLNKPADICLYGCLPKTQEFRDRKARDRYRKRVRQMTEDKGAEFIDYDCDQGVWHFRVTHF